MTKLAMISIPAFPLDGAKGKNAAVPARVHAQLGETMAIAKSSNDRDKASATAPEPWSALIVKIAAEQSESAFKTLFHHFAPRVKSFAMRGGYSDGFAEDIAQETLLTVWRKAHQFDPQKASAATWIYTISRNKKIDKLRKDAKPLPDKDDPVYAYSAIRSPEEETADDQSATRINASISALPDDQRRAVSLAFTHDMAHGEIAKTLNLPLGTVKSRIRLGLAKLRKDLSDLDSQSSAQPDTSKTTQE